MKKSIIIFILVITLLSGCNNSKTNLIEFTSLDFNSSKEQLLSVEGTPLSIEDTIHGLTYSYPKIYNQLTGTIEYTFDSNGKLYSISWSYSPMELQSLKDLYSRFVAQAGNKYEYVNSIGNPEKDDIYNTSFETKNSSNQKIIYLVTAASGNGTNLIRISYVLN